MPPELTPKDFAQAASILGCEPAAIQAVASVESASSGFLKDGRPKVLFEAHIFSRLTEHKYDHSAPLVSSRVWNQGLYRGGEAEHERLALACELNRAAALQSTSWGKFQIMGFNWKRCGFEILQQFINAMYAGEAEQLIAFANFVKSMGLDDELREQNWAAFARGYNGPGYAANRYDVRLAQAFALYRPRTGQVNV